MYPKKIVLKNAHMHMSIVIYTNEKFRRIIQVWYYSRSKLALSESISFANTDAVNVNKNSVILWSIQPLIMISLCALMLVHKYNKFFWQILGFIKCKLLCTQTIIIDIFIVHWKTIYFLIINLKPCLIPYFFHSLFSYLAPPPYMLVLYQEMWIKRWKRQISCC